MPPTAIKNAETDPTAGIRIKLPKSDGHHTWSEDEIARFEAKHPVGSRERLAFPLLVCTGQRRSDVLRMGRQHIRDGILSIKQRKTGVEVDIPVHPELAAAIGSERFLSEIRTTAKLQHPNILPLLDSGDVDGLLYYVMPFVDGESRFTTTNTLPAGLFLRGFGTTAWGFQGAGYLDFIEARPAP